MKSSTKKIIFVAGTRPEAIKLAPLIIRFRENSAWQVKFCVTAQHRELLDQVLQFFELLPDVDFNLMEPSQTLSQITTRGLEQLETLFVEEQPDLVVVQGDTTTAFIGGLAAFYQKIPVAHIEAGLRTGDMYSPYPEEINRKLLSCLSTIHFAPTELAAQKLRSEGYTKNVHMVGNTVIDALHDALDKINGSEKFAERFQFLKQNCPIILITGHRRESFGEPFEHICNALREIAQRYPGHQLVYPVHLNQNVREPVNRILHGLANVHLIEPLDYPEFVWLLNACTLVLTDSGGVQEEAPSLGKPVLVMRDVTERTEGIDAGTAALVGTNHQKIVNKVSRLLDSAEEYQKFSRAVNPYGDGTSVDKIYKVCEAFFDLSNTV